MAYLKKMFTLYANGRILIACSLLVPKQHDSNIRYITGRWVFVAHCRDVSNW